MYDYEDEDEDDLIDCVGFANAGSALRSETENNRRVYQCPTCKMPNRLTRIDVQRGYQCDRCADNAESGIDNY